MSTSSPTLVLIIRHGEKLGDPSDDTTGGPNLSVRGSSRAAALPSLFETVDPGWCCALSASSKSFAGAYTTVGTQPATPTYAVPDFLFATAASKNSNRPVETITPLSVALGLSIDDKHADNDYQKVADDILQNAKYAGKVVLVCWHHGHIPDLANALHAQNVPAKWSGTVFDQVWQIPFSDNAAGALAISPQSLLFGDAAG
jgi:hypothetical protein